MKTIKTIEKFDKDGKLIERITETVETIEVAPFNPMPYYQPPQPIIIQPNPWPSHWPVVTCEPPQITRGSSTGQLTCGRTQ